MRIAVVGGGAAGLFAAGIASHNGAETVLIERNSRMGVKLRITFVGWPRESEGWRKELKEEPSKLQPCHSVGYLIDK